MTLVRKYILPYAKAHVAAWGSAAALFVADYQAGHISNAQWLAIVLVGLGIGGSVAAVANKTLDDVTAAPSVPAKVEAAVADVAPAIQDIAS